MIYDPEYLKDDWNKDRQAQDLGTEEQFGHRPARPRYFREDTKEDFLQEIAAENVRASDEKINCHE